MFSDYEEFESPLEVLLQRERDCGFKPQAENIYNSLLPYSSKLDSESKDWLRRLKSTLCDMICRRHLYYGLAAWMQSFNKYMKLYGLKFSKADHLTFIKVLYEFITSSRVDYAILCNGISLLSTLLYRRYLIESSELSLEWKPLYDLFESHFSSGGSKHNMFQVPPSLRNGLRVLIRYAQPYFPPGATRDILEHFKPLMCPIDSSSEKAFDMLQMFLPTYNAHGRADETYQLWLDDLIAYLKIFNSPHIQGYIFMLYSRLAEDNIGDIDWNPWLPLLFSKIQRFFDLPVGYKNVHVGIKSYPYSANQMQIATRWIVATMGGSESQTQEYLNKVFKSLESYFHPTNVGPYSSKLIEFLARLCLNFVRRLRHEGCSRKRWGDHTPQDKKLSDEDITKFVESVKPLVLLSLYSRVGVSEKGQILSILATLRPQLIIPELVERMNTSLEALNEPHKLTASIAALASVARPMVTAGNGYPQGSTCVIPILISSLPGLDPNDLHKSISTLQLIANFCMLIPIVDCTKGSSAQGLSAEEDLLRSQTASFEDFVIQFLDRCFALIDNSSFEYTREFVQGSVELQGFQEEGLLYTWVESAFQSILFQTSTEIYDTVLKKLQNYIKHKILEHNIAGKLAGGLCHAVTRVDPKKGLQAFLTNAITNIKNMIASHDGILLEENSNTEIMFNLRIISEVINFNGYELISYVEELEEVLDMTLLMKNSEGSTFSCSILKKLLSTLAFVYPLEYRLLPDGYDDHSRPYIKDWGACGDIHNLKLKLHQPTEKEMACVQRLINKYIGGQLDALDNFVNGKQNMLRTEMKNRLNIIKEAVIGSSYVLPLWDHEESLCLVPDGSIPFVIQDNIIVHSEKMEINLNGENVRWKIVQVLDKLQSKLMKDEDDTKSLTLIAAIYFCVQDDFGIRKEKYNNYYSTVSSETGRLENKLLGKKANIRSTLIEQMMLQHHCRVTESMHFKFTPSHLKIMNNLVKLSTAKYHDVRIVAQDVLIMTINQVLCSYLKLVPSLIEILKSSDVTEEQLKGVFFLIKGSSSRSLISKHNWQVQEKLWQAIIDSPSSEKPTVISVMENGLLPIVRNCVSFVIHSELPDRFIKYVLDQFKANGTFGITEEAASPEEQKKWLETLNRNNMQNMVHYTTLVNSLTSSLENGNLHWRRYKFAYSMLIRLIRCDIDLPVKTISIFVKNILSENLYIRAASIYAVTRILRQLKRSHPKIKVSVPELSLTSTVPGDREDNEWLCYNPSNIPDSQEKWDMPRYVHKPHYGYNIWPKVMEVYAPYASQPKLHRSRDELPEREKVIYDFFMDKDNIKRMIHFHSLEYNKEHDKFAGEKFAFFKALFRNFGNTFLHLFKPHLEELVKNDLAGHQRCACEIIAGMIRGAKHWNYADTEDMYGWLIPLIRSALENVSPDSCFDWGTCFATSSESRDPSRMHWVLRVLMEEPIRSQGSFIDSSRLYVLQGLLSQQEWRVGHFLYELNDFLKPFLTHPFKNVRDRLGSVLMSIYMIDVSDSAIQYTRGPRLKEFFQTVVPQLQIVIEDSEEKKGANVTVSISNESSELHKGLRLLQTVSKFITCIVTRGLSEIRIDFFNILPMLCVHQANTFEPSLAQDCIDSLAALSQSILPQQIVPEWIEVIQRGFNMTSWKARLALLEFLQVSVFCNFPMFVSEEAWSVKLSDMVIFCLKDARIEVREKASFVLGGLIHSNFIPGDKRKDLLKSFMKRARVNVKGDDSLIRRHSGILGLCAFVIAHPYEVPEHIPDCLVALSEHLHDPQPIPDVIRRTMQDFKRTHRSNWQEHKLQFSEDQLSVLSDIFVAPSYYA